MPEPTSLFLERAVKDLEQLRSEAEQYGGELALLFYILDMALVEAQARQGSAEKKKPPQPEQG